MVSVPSRIFTKMNSSTEHDRIIFVIMIIKIFQNIYYIFSHCYSDCYVQNTVSRSLTLVWRHNKNIDPLIPKNCRRSNCPKEDDVFADATAHDYNIPDYLHKFDISMSLTSFCVLLPSRDDHVVCIDVCTLQCTSDT